MSRVSVEKEALERLLNAMIGGSRCALDECPTNVSMICDDCRRLALDIQPIEEPTNAEAMLADALARVRELERELKVTKRMVEEAIGDCDGEVYDVVYAAAEEAESEVEG